MSDRGPLALHRELEAAWSTPPGIRGWLSAVNHTAIGARFMMTAVAFFLIGGVLGLLIRAQLAGPATHFLDAPAYAQIFTMHGTVMMFLFAIPMIEGFTLWILPKILGARDLAFPRLSAFGYWCYVMGGTILLVAMLFGLAPDTGWFMYTPLASRPYSPGINADVWLIGVTFVEISAVAFSIEVVVTVLKVRAPGMSLMRMPLLAWYLLITAAMMLVGFPPLIVASVLLEVERAYGLPFFDPARGGDPLLWQHLFWMFGHPEVYIIFLPGAAIVSTIVAVHSGRPLVGYSWIVGALVAQAFLSFGLWVHHMFTTGLPHLSLAIFSAASLLVVLPTSIQLVAWIATLWSGRPRLTLPMYWVLGFLFVFVTGGLTGVMVALLPIDVQVHDTHFVVAHLHYVLVGGFVFPVVGALYHWLPLASARIARRGLGLLGFWLVFIGFNLTFMIMHLTGLLGMPRRVYTYAAGLGWDVPNLISSVGAFVMAIGFATVLIDLVIQWRFGARCPPNPWRAPGLEWAIPRPPTSYAFPSLPTVRSREPLHDDPTLPARLAAGDGLLPGAPTGRMETLGVSMMEGRADQLIRLPAPSLLPLSAAAAAAVFFLSILLSLYWLALAGALAMIGVLLRWMWQTGLRTDPRADSVDEAALPPSSTAAEPPVRLALFAWFTVDATFLASLLFGVIFLRVVTPGVWPADPHLPSLALLLIAGSAPALAALFAAMASRAVARDARPAGMLAAATLSGAGAIVANMAILLGVPAPDVHVHGATLVALAAFNIIHLIVSVLGSGYALARWRSGYVSARRSIDPLNARDLAIWTAIACACTTLLLGWPLSP